jgi:hypothetical protein
MSDLPSINSARGANAAPVDANHGDAEWSRDGVHIARADGLRGALGLYAVTANGHTRYLTRQEADDLKQALTPVDDAQAHGAHAPPGKTLAGGTARAPGVPAFPADATCGRDPCFTDDDVYQPSDYATRAWAPKARTVEGAPGPVHDVKSTPQSKIDELKNSRNPAEQRLGRTIENARVAYADLIAKGAHIVVTTSAGNGGEPVLVVKGPGFDASQPARVHTHYHGDNATVADGLGSKAGTGARIRAVIARDPQTVFVLPESRVREGVQLPDSAAHNGHYKAKWDNATSQVRTTDDALEAAGITRVSKDVVSFHSRGGEAIQNIMSADPTGGGLRAQRIELHDCLYGSQYAMANWAATANGRDVGRVIFYHGTNRANAHQPVEQALRGKFTRVEMSRQAPLDEATNPVHRDADGRTHQRTVSWTDPQGVKHPSTVPVRRFDRDPHYRTTGQFLDASH